MTLAEQVRQRLAALPSEPVATVLGFKVYVVDWLPPGWLEVWQGQQKISVRIKDSNDAQGLDNGSIKKEAGRAGR
jgi:hypothetical protein